MICQGWRKMLILSGAFTACLALATLLIGWIVWSPFTIANDYYVWPIYPNLIQHYYESRGAAAQWYPHYSGGVPFAGFVGIQLFHLPRWIISHLPAYANGGALILNSYKHILLFACSHMLAMYFLVAFAGLRLPLAFIFSAPLLYNLRTLDALRYGMYFEAAVYYQAAALCTVWFTKRRNTLLLILIGVLFHCLLTSGYPPVLFWGAAITALVALLILPQTPGRVFDSFGVIVRAGPGLASVAIIALLLATPNWWPASEMLKMNSVRVLDSTLEWARLSPLTWHSLLANLFFPWESEIHSAFGGSTLETILLLGAGSFCLLRLRSYWWALLLLFFLFAYAFGGALFEAFYNYVPGFRWIRAPGRILVFLPTVCLMSAAVIASDFQRKEPENLRRSLSFALNCASVLTLLFTIGLCLLRLSDSPLWGALEGSGFTPARIGEWPRTWKGIWLLGGISTSIAAFLWMRMKGPTSKAVLLLVLFGSFLLQAYPTERFGIWSERRYPSATMAEFSIANHLHYFYTYPVIGQLGLDENAGGLATTGYTHFRKATGSSADCILPVEKGASKQSILLPFYLTKRLSCVEEEEASQQLSQLHCSAQSTGMAIVPPSICSIVKPEASVISMVELNERNQLLYLGPGSATISVATSSPSLLITPYPWIEGFWKVTVDGTSTEPVEIDRGLTGVVVPSGEHRVRIAYVSSRTRSARWLVFSTVFVLACFSICRLVRDYQKRRSSKAIALVAIVLASVSVSSYRWAKHYDTEVMRDIELQNNYADLLKQQLGKWRGQTVIDN